MYMHVVTESTEGGSAQELEKFVLLEDVPTPDADNVIILVTDETESEVVSQLDQPLEISREQKTESIPKDVEQKDCIPEDVDELQRITAVQLSCVNEEASNVQVLEKTVISEETAVPCLDNAVVIDEHKHEVRLSVVQVSVEGEKGSELKSIEIPKQEIEARVEPEEKVPVEDAKTEHVQELQVLPSDVKDIVTETKSEEGASMYMHVVTESTEGGSAQELEKFVLLDVPTPDADNVITSITDKTESEVVSQLDQALEISGEQKTESIPQEVEQENCIPEDVDELQTLPAVNLSSINEAASNVQVLENTDNDNAAVTDEHKYEDHESELPSTEIKTVAIEHAVVAQVVTCNLKEVLVAIPDVLIEKTSDITEPLIDRMASEQVFREEVESATPLVKDEEGSLETVVESLLEVGVTEAKEVIDVCHETVKRVEILSTTPETEEGLINEEKHVTIQEVFQHIKENLPETVPQSVVVSFEQEVKQHHDAMTEVSELVESESNEMKDQEAMKSSIGTLRGRQEAPTVMNDEFATEQVSDDCMQTSDIPGSLDVSIHGHKEDLDVTKDEWEQSEAGVTANEVKPPSEELDVKTNSEQAPTPQIAQSLIVTPSNTGLVIPQNTGIISSIGNVESPSSLSLEFKLNIQFGQAKAPASSSTTTERTEPVKQMSEVGVQAVEAVKPINLTQRDESQKQTELTEVAVQVITEPATHLDSTERPVITSQPVLLDIGIQAMEKVGSEEQIKSTDTEISSVQATETLQAVGQTEKIEVFLSQPVLSEGCNQETKAEEPVKQEEENDQDVWMDAEEVIYTQKETEVSLFEVEESPGPQAESNTEEKAGLQHEVEMASYSKTEEDGSQQEMHRTGGMCEIESDGEDFAVALEHPETATASITTMEWD
ncbi:protein IQ-DOMAIN 32-like [Micropterus salmoides]|uniref:protein IQ-DOMAIN 32-like n=1 Tax=Micropterus salmoides TaxID=27706 RepID=UPI0018EC1D21|nr:protein IQ-DOMAIN 32-like [Micropterus salmoides]